MGVASDYQSSAARLLARQGEPVKHGLPQMCKYLASLGNPQDSFKTIHVTGTNGKGSVCALLAEALRRSGYRTGLFISPHLMDLRERIQIDGRMISPGKLAALLRELERSAPLRLSFFEAMACAAFLYFRHERVDYAVIEVGIGGRLDVTNALERPEAAVITSVGLDHTAMLGATLEKIAYEKAGIIKPGSRCVCGKLSPGALRVVRAAARKAGAPLYFPAGDNAFRPCGTDWRRGKLFIVDSRGRKYSLNLLGEKQADNASLAAQTLAVLRSSGAHIPLRAVREAFSRVNWPGRFQILRRGGRTLILDGAHNPDAASVFSRTLSASPFGRRRPVLMLGMLKDKDCPSVVRALRPHLGRVIVTAPPSPRALDAHALARLVAAARPDAQIEVVESHKEALRRVLECRMAAVVGSFYLAGAALALVKRLKRR